MKKVDAAVENRFMSNICWSCHDKIGEDLICEICGKLQPLCEKNPFDCLSLEVSFRVDKDTLEKNYLSSQRQLHPDRFANASKTERVYAAQHSAALNAAYDCLKDPIKRAQALLKVHQHKSANIEDQTLQDHQLLMQVIELREQLADVLTEEDIQALRESIEDKLSTSLNNITSAFDAHDLDQAAACLNQLRYFSKLKAEAKNKRAA